MNSAVAPVGIGESVGPYRIEGLLGTGGMGHVYLAVDTRLLRTVAIKFPVGASQTHDALWQEARLAAALNHPAICTVHEVGELNQAPYLVMEHIRGVSLSALLEIHGALAAATAVAFALQIAEAIAHAHDRDIVHGDIKSSNVMVESEGRLKVLDFGVGVRRGHGTGPGDATTSPTQSNSGAGTVPYMAPELLRGHLPDVQSDVWALGVLLFEMLTGTRPFRGSTPYETAAHILGNERLTSHRGLAPDVSAVIDRCLSARPGDRYCSARDFAVALQDLHDLSGASEKVEPRASIRFVTALSRDGR